MKPSRLPFHVRAVVDMLERLGARIVDVARQKRIVIIWTLAGREMRGKIASALPKSADLAMFAAKECERFRAMCTAAPVRARA